MTGKIKTFSTALVLGIVLLSVMMKILPNKILGVESCCERSCSCPTSTPTIPVPTPTCSESSPTPTPDNPTPTVSEPSPTPTFVPSPTLTPKPEEGGIGGPSDDGGSGGPVGAPVCTDSVPSKPFLREAKTLGNGKVSLLWDMVEPTTHYTIAYGPTSGNYLYGVDNTGKTSSFIIGGLGRGNYCFAVRGVNNCMPGGFSNELCTGQSGKVLGATVLGATGSFNDNLLQIAFIMGTICSSIGIRLLFGNKNSA